MMKILGGTVLAMVVLLLVVAQPAGAGAADPASIDFGAVPLNRTASQAVTLTIDTGFQVSAFSGEGIRAPFGIDIGDCFAVTGPGTCTFTQKFTPTSVGSFTGMLHARECPLVGTASCIDIPVSLQGSGISLAKADPASIDFGAVPLNTTASQAVTLTIDTGFQVSAFSGEGIRAPFGIDIGDCFAVTGPGTCTFTQKFTPTSVGSFTGMLHARECPLVGTASCIDIPVSLQGSGISLAKADPASSDFGAVPLNTTASQAVTLTIDTGFQVSAFSGEGIRAPFGIDIGDCFAVTGPGTCTFTQKFTPTSVGSFTGMLHARECPLVGTASCIDIPVSLQGSGVQIATTTSLASSANPSILGQSVTFTATVASASGSTTPTGTVTFSDGATPLATVPLGGGTASFTTSGLTAGEHTIGAAYSGGGAFAPSSANLTQTVQDAAALLSLLAAEVAGLPPGTSLSEKVQKAQDFLAEGAIAKACKTMDDFISEVRSQTGKKIPAALARKLITDAMNVKIALGC